MVKSSVQIKGDRAVTYSILTDFSKYTEWYPDCEKCEVVARAGTTVDVEIFLMRVKLTRMILRYDCQPNCVTVSMVSSPDLEDFNGGYRIIEGDDGEHTVMMEMDLITSAPRFVTDLLVKSSLERQAAQLQQRATEGLSPRAPNGHAVFLRLRADGTWSEF